MIYRFKNREEAGLLLGKAIKEKYPELNRSNAVILAIPRGGVPVAYYVAKETGIPFSVVITKKITSPSNPEAALGAVSVDGSFVLSDIAKAVFPMEALEAFAKDAYMEALRRVEKYQVSNPDLKGKTVLIVDDGVATGYTAIASALYAKNKGASRVILAVPVCPVDSLERLKEYFDDVICLEPVDTPAFAVGAFYEDFHQVEDDEFFRYIEKAKAEGLLAE